ncbi:MAG: 23S rRNA (uracil(1939)-C(5))-methyltransferase RlmD [Clostridia bacterium]|nr:23S rRNA (uracil(1939)-C(5))-methyltransferase RlmD [Clostridia bacterium]
MIEKNEIICAVTEGLGSNGEGIIRHEGITFFVPACLPGEKVRFKVLKIKGNVGYGKVEEVLTPAEERVRPKCPVFMRCGGCSLQHLDYVEQMAYKANVVKEALRKIGGIQMEVPTAIKSDFPYGYRNKLQMPIGIDKEGNNVIGFYAERSHRIVPVRSCAIHPDWAETLISLVKRYMDENGVRGYDEVSKSGSLRHIVAREIGGKFIFTLVTAKRNLPNLSRFVELLSGAFKTFSLYLNFNSKDTNVIFGEEFQLVHGIGIFEAEEQGIRYEAGPSTFLQVNENVRGKLYKAAVATVTADGDEVVVDAYSGGGLMTAMVAKKAKRVYGIELEKEASLCADALKAKNGLLNMTNICGYVEEELPKVLEKEKGEKLRLILDPPRAGIARSVLQALLQSGIPYLTIISCNPATLARDLGILTGRLVEENGELVKNPAYNGIEKGETLSGYYEVKKIQPYDMFPQTKHVETLVCLARKAD